MARKNRSYRNFGQQARPAPTPQPPTKKKSKKKKKQNNEKKIAVPMTEVHSIDTHDASLALIGGTYNLFHANPRAGVSKFHLATSAPGLTSIVTFQVTPVNTAHTYSRLSKKVDFVYSDSINEIINLFSSKVRMCLNYPGREVIPDKQKFKLLGAGANVKVIDGSQTHNAYVNLEHVPGDNRKAAPADSNI